MKQEKIPTLSGFRVVSGYGRVGLPWGCLTVLTHRSNYGWAGPAIQCFFLIGAIHRTLLLIFAFSLFTFRNVFQQSAVVDYFECEVRQGIKNYIRAGRLVLYRAGFEIDLKLIAVIDPLRSVGRFDKVKAVIDCVAIEDPGERFCDNGLNAHSADRPDGMLPRGAAAEILAGYNYIALADLIDKFAVQILQAMARKLGPVVGIQVPCGDDFVCIYMVSFVYVRYTHFYNLKI